MHIATSARPLAVVFTPFLMAAILLAQAAGPATPPGLLSSTAPANLPASETFRARVDEVNVVFTVSDNGGKLVNQLSLDDLTVLDNRVAPVRINYFQRETDLPLRVGVLVDLSNSIGPRFAYEKRAAIAFLQKVLRPQLDEAFIVGFASHVELFQDFTGDVGALSAAVHRMKAGGDTRLYDAIRYASEKLGRVSGSGPARRAIIVISDGDDTRSSTIMYDAIQSALHGEVVMFALSSNDLTGGIYPHGEAVLELLTRPTGGGVLPAHSNGEISRAFDKVRDSLRSQYAIGYTPAAFKPDGSFRSIQIVPRKAKLHAQCRRGYFAPREDAPGN